LIQNKIEGAKSKVRKAQGSLAYLTLIFNKLLN
jgi:hypothetical protein